MSEDAATLGRVEVHPFRYPFSSIRKTNLGSGAQEQKFLFYLTLVLSHGREVSEDYKSSLILLICWPSNKCPLLPYCRKCSCAIP